MIESRFFNGLARLLEDVERATGFRLVWKDADPAFWGLTPDTLGSHQNPWCRRIKRGTGAYTACRRVDNLVASDWPEGDRPRLRTCPFAVREWVVPVFAGGRYHGCFYLGPWRGASSLPGARGHSTGLLPFPGRARAEAAGRLALAALLPLLSAREAEGALHASRGDQLMQGAVAYIGEHLAAGLHAGEVARAADLSVSRFLHRFRAATGERFRRHVERRLMAEAARRLADPDLSIADLAEALGFRDPNYFSTAFRRVYGAPPRKWRRGLPPGPSG